MTEFVLLTVQRARPLRDQLHDCERQLIAEAMRVSRGNAAAAARILGIHRGHLSRRIRALGVTPTPSVAAPIPGDPVDARLGDLEQRLRDREAGQ